MTDFLQSHYHWLFSGLGVAILFAVFGFLRRKASRSSSESTSAHHIRSATNSDIIQSGRDTHVHINSTQGAHNMPQKAAAVIKEDLLHIVRKLQRTWVRESSGEAAYQCFTDDDLEKFHHDAVVERISADLKHDSDLLRVVDELRTLAVTEKSAIISSIRCCYKQTWAKIGEITPEGQTEAGQTAERAVANAVGDIVETLLR